MLYFRIFAVRLFYSLMSKNLIKSRLVWLTLALLALVPFLAYLQWKWVGEAVEREEEQLRGALKTAAVQFLYSFNQRIIQVQQSFSTITKAVPKQDFSTLNTAQKQKLLTKATQEYWAEHQSGLEADLIQDVYYLVPNENNDDEWLVTRFDTTSKELVPSAMPLTALQEDELESFPPISRFIAGLTAIVIPLQNSNLTPMEFDESQAAFLDEMVLFGVPKNPTILVMIHQKYLQHEVLPSLVQNHFGEINRLQFQCGIVQRKEDKNSSTKGSKSSSNQGLNVLWSSDSTAQSSDFMNSSISLPIGFLPPRVGGGLAKMLPNFISLISQISKQKSSEKNISGTPLVAPKMGADSTFIRYLLGNVEFHVQYKRDALESELSQIRWRNVAVSFGVLLLLSVGLVLIMLTVARSERLQHQQMQFVAGISHEFRTPLAVLSSASENLADGIVTSPEQAQRYGKVMKQEIMRLTGMVEQTLSFAGIQARRHTIEPKPVSVQTLVEQAITRHQGLLKDEAFLLTVQIPPKTAQMLVLADATALMTVFDNLINNAVKYTENRREIRIDAVLQDAVILISIQDFGRGIPASEIAHIFEPFFRAQSVVDAQIHGNGLGLAIVQHIIAQHGGTISAKSEVGRGTTFFFTLKRA
ncbi:MAG: sensor histidine kinase [Candidatus Kapaibacterium sp.]|nr:MAG: sensor histidine kinase [Candidatus Kapabacteria bacterium]